MRQVTKYTTAIKASVLTKVLSPNGPSVVELAKEFNIPKATIQGWVWNMKKKDIRQEPSQQRPNEQSATSKFQAVIDTIGRTE